MIYNNTKAAAIAQSLLDIEAIKLQPTNPFTWASGWKSPIYCDNRKTLSYPAIRKVLKDSFSEAISHHFGNAEVIAGVATAGIPHGALIADALNLPFVYVRSSSKSHGLQNQIEGHLEKGKKVVVVEDLISTGKSSLAAVDAIREAGGEVMGLVAIFTYGFDLAVKNFEAKQCPFITLSNYEKLIELAAEKGIVEKDQLEMLNQWRTAPDQFGK